MRQIIADAEAEYGEYATALHLNQTEARHLLNDGRRELRAQLRALQERGPGR